jgi:hypothetical protein
MKFEPSVVRCDRRSRKSCPEQRCHEGLNCNEGPARNPTDVSDEEKEMRITFKNMVLNLFAGKFSLEIVLSRLGFKRNFLNESFTNE